MVLEVDLHDFVGQSEHDGVSRSHPFLDIDHVFKNSFLSLWFLLLFGPFSLREIRFQLLALLLVLLRCQWLLARIQIRSKMLQQSNFLLQLLGIIGQSVFLTHIFLVACSSLIVVKVMTSRVKNNLSGIVEEDTCGLVRKKISEAVFRTIVNPFLHPDIWAFDSVSVRS